MMGVLHAAESLGLPQWIVGAGFIRNFVWDIQHGRTPSHASTDVDVIYFDRAAADPRRDQAFEEKLRAIRPDINWEVTNQAHVHTYNDPDTPPYASAADGLAHWTETATCTGLTMENRHLKLIAPWGVDDLLALKLRLPPVHAGKPLYRKIFEQRIAEKRWLETWPLLAKVE